MGADIQPIFIRSVARQAVCWLLLAVYGLFGISVPVPAEEETYGEVIFRVEADVAEEGSFLRVYLSSEQSVDSFLLHFFLLSIAYSEVLCNAGIPARSVRKNLHRSVEVFATG